MVGLYRQIPTNPLLQQFGRSQLRFPLSASLGAVTEDPLVSPSEMITRQRELNEARGLRGALGQPDLAPDAGEDLSPLVSAEDLNKRYGHLGLSFDTAEREEAAQILAEQKRAEIIRETVIAQGPGGIGTMGLQFGAALARAVLDPLNVAASFVPVVGQARYARWASRIGSLRARAATGAIEGTVGAIVVEPITLGLAQSQQLDYDMADALVNVSIGTVLGTGLQVGVGALGDASGRIASRRLTAQIERARAHEEAVRAAVAQTVQGRLVDVGPVFDSLMSGTSPAALNAGRAAPEIDMTPRARAEAVEPAEPVFAGIRVPSATRQGELRAFATEREARQAARRLQGGSTVRQAADGRFAVMRDRPDVEVSREPDGTVRQFRSLRQAERFIQQSAGERFRAFPLGGARFGVARGLSDRDLDLIAANPGMSVVEDTPRSPFTPAPVRQTRSLEADIRAVGLPTEIRPSVARRRLAAEMAPERDASADFRAAELVTAESRALVTAETPEAAQSEADFMAGVVDDLRQQGRLTAADNAEVEELAQFLERAEAYGRAARQAAVCMTRP